MAQTSTVFTGLLRQPQFLGVDYNAGVLIGMVSILAFLNVSAWGLLIGLPLHGFAWILCRIDPHIFALLMRRARIGQIKNFRIWGVQTYEPL